jgi:hypothetical protein
MRALYCLGVNSQRTESDAARCTLVPACLDAGVIVFSKSCPSSSSSSLCAPMFVVPLAPRIARYAGYLRRPHRLKTPDSAIATTAIRTKTTPHLSGVASRVSPWYDGNIDTTPFELTPEQKGMLASLSRETGKAIPALIAEALEELQKHVHSQQGNGEPQSGDADQAVPPSQKAAKPIWEQFIEASLTIPDEELDRLPFDGATQHDHYIYGTPKRPV